MRSRAPWLHDPLWRRALLAPAVQPAAAVAVAVAVAVLSAVTASAPLFLSSVGNAALRSRLAEVAPVFSGLVVSTTAAADASAVAAVDTAVREELERRPLRGRPRPVSSPEGQ